MTIIPPTNARVFSIQNVRSSSAASRKKSKATKAPIGSARPDILASAKLNQGLSGRAARQGMAIAIPSGMLWIIIPTVTVIPSFSDSNADTATAVCVLIICVVCMIVWCVLIMCVCMQVICESMKRIVMCGYERRTRWDTPHLDKNGYTYPHKW